MAKDFLPATSNVLLGLVCFAGSIIGMLEPLLERQPSLPVPRGPVEIEVPPPVEMNAPVFFRRTGPRMSEQDRDQVDTAYTCAQHMLSLVNDLLDFAALQAGRLSVVRESFVVRSLVRRCMSVVTPLAQTKRLDLSSRVAADVPYTFIGDSRRISQILLNFLSNAVKFTEVHIHGRVHLSVERLNVPVPIETMIEVPDALDQLQRVQVQTSMIRFVVLDTGLGINPDKLKKVMAFQPFTQMDPRVPGTGLGLVLSKQLADAMGGNLSGDSTPGQGSEFRFDVPLPTPVDEETTEGKRSLEEKDEHIIVGVGPASAGVPLQSPAPQSLAPPAVGPIALPPGPAVPAVPVVPVPISSIRGLEPASSIPLSLHSSTPPVAAPVAVPAPSLAPVASVMHVLVVDDDLTNRRIASRLIQKLGMEVDTANDGQQALDMFVNQPQRYQVILMDCNMPIMDGYESTIRIRAAEAAVQRAFKLGVAVSDSAMIPAPPHTFILGFTADESQRNIDQCRAVGMDDIVAKPFRKTELVGKLQRVRQITARQEQQGTVRVPP